jgi:hypothetical protein
MSYCRFSDESDVYVYSDVGGWLSCCSCALVDDSQQWRHFSTDAMIAHLREHIAAGHDVPDDVILALEAHREENDTFIADVRAAS